jgi:very-short-patch-repair endonuclease
MEKAKLLRTNMTVEEMRLWYLLRGRRFFGYKFRRQMPVGPYFVDFACFKAKLIVELDGGQHQDNHDYDVRRSTFLNAHGWEVIRFWNNELRENEEGVLEVILAHLTRLLPSPRPSPTGEGENNYTPEDRT